MLYLNCTTLQDKECTFPPPPPPPPKKEKKKKRKKKKEEELNKKRKMRVGTIPELYTMWHWTTIRIKCSNAQNPLFKSSKRWGPALHRKKKRQGKRAPLEFPPWRSVLVRGAAILPPDVARQKTSAGHSPSSLTPSGNQRRQAHHSWRWHEHGTGDGRDQIYNSFTCTIRGEKKHTLSRHDLKRFPVWGRTWGWAGDGGGGGDGGVVLE